MKFYLSSHGVGTSGERLQDLVGDRMLGFIPNALDHVAELQAEESHARCVEPLLRLGLRFDRLDLRDYFGRPKALSVRLGELGGLWVRGGNTYVLRQAMQLSGFDSAILGVDDPDFVWAGYSAGICVLAPSLEGLELVDDPSQRPYGEVDRPRAGLGFFDYLMVPHYRSGHFESEAIEDVVEFCLRKGLPFRTLRDGEVLILDRDVRNLGAPSNSA